MCIDPRYPGSVHDSFVWQFSWLRNQLEQGQLPRDGGLLLGDRGYPLEPWLINPVLGNRATSTACGRFNKAHSSVRSVLERCIGLLKNRFRCLQRHRALYYHPSTATAIISACAVLHNICLASSEPEPELDSDPEESELESEPSSDGSEPSSERPGLQVGPGLQGGRGCGLLQHPAGQQELDQGAVGVFVSRGRPVKVCKDPFQDLQKLKWQRRFINIGQHISIHPQSAKILLMPQLCHSAPLWTCTAFCGLVAAPWS
ncbi:putative nuclease HARBI1 [Ixodes scapularis]